MKARCPETRLFFFFHLFFSKTKLTMWAMMLSLCREGCRLKRTMSPSIMCLSTTSPNLSSWAIFSRFPYFKNLAEDTNTKIYICFKRWTTSGKEYFLICQRRSQPYLFICVLRFWMKLAPGWTSGPLRTSFLNSSRLALFTYNKESHLDDFSPGKWLFSVGRLTFSGYVRILATCTGTATSSILRFGSGEMTVLPEKSTLFPERFPLNRPEFFTVNESVSLQFKMCSSFSTPSCTRNFCKVLLGLLNPLYRH